MGAAEALVADSESGPRSTRALRVLLVAAIVGALAVLLGPFGVAASLGGVAVVVAATILAAPLTPPQGWWSAMALGAALALAGELVGLVADTPGGLLSVVGGVTVVAAATMGFPTSGE